MVNNGPKAVVCQRVWLEIPVQKLRCVPQGPPSIAAHFCAVNLQSFTLGRQSCWEIGSQSLLGQLAAKSSPRCKGVQIHSAKMGCFIAEW